MRPRTRMNALFTAVGIAAVCCYGCGAPGKHGQHATASFSGPTTIASIDGIRFVTQGLADSYVTSATQVYDELLATTQQPAIKKWAMSQKVATATASYTNATQENPFVGGIDLVILITLKRMALEEYWVPNLLKDEGTKALAAAKKAEEEAWTMAAKVLSKRQVDDLHEIIDQWIADHPGQYYVGWVRLTDIAADRAINPQSPQVKVPGNIFGLLYLDPLAGLDPVTQEIRNYRALTERLTYLFMRMPIVYSWQAQMTFDAMTDTGSTREFVSATSRFADATSRFADAAKGYPDAIDKTMDKSIQNVSGMLTRERTAAIEQADKSVTSQREALVAAVDAQHEKVQNLVTVVRATIGDAERSVQTIRATSSETIEQANLASERLVNQARNAVLLIILAACVVPAVVLLAYRVLNRWISSRVGQGV
jgi:hypothetical protein